MIQKHVFAITAVLCVCLSLATKPQPANAAMRIRDLCRVKGQEENVLQGLGLVVGLKGTGDSDSRPTSRALAKMLASMGNPIAQDPSGLSLLDELKGSRNVALVFVTATVPAAGARQGDKLDCSVHAFDKAKSLVGGYLMVTPLMGPRPGVQRVYALAQGPINLENLNNPVTGKIHGGCRLEESFENEFVKNGVITLVLDKNHANFTTAHDIAELISNSPDAKYDQKGSNDKPLAQAKDQVNISVRIPEKYIDVPVEFISQILNQQVFNLQSEARVVINERAGTIIIGADVEIGPVAVTHPNITIEAGPFFPLDPGSNTAGTKLKALVDALNGIKATPQDIIEIIKGIERDGQLFGRLIIE